MLLKWQNRSQRAVPDRILVVPGLPEAQITFIEFKALGKKPTKLQRHMLETLAGKGCYVYVIDSYTDFVKLLPPQVGAAAVSREGDNLHI